MTEYREKSPESYGENLRTNVNSLLVWRMNIVEMVKWGTWNEELWLKSGMELEVEELHVVISECNWCGKWTGIEEKEVGNEDFCNLVARSVDTYPRGCI